MKDLEYTKEQYNKEENVKRYGEAIKIGLWNSERLFFEKYINKDDYILDLGCGAGRTTFALYNLRDACKCSSTSITAFSNI